MRIGQLASTVGVGIETVRFYERKGLINQPLKPHNGGFRSYSKDTVARVQFIREAQDLGFSLREIEELLSLRSDPATDCADVRERALIKRDEVDEKIKHLGRIRKALDALVSACPRKGAAELCSILAAMESGKRPTYRSRSKRKNGNP